MKHRHDNKIGITILSKQGGYNKVVIITFGNKGMIGHFLEQAVQSHF